MKTSIYIYILTLLAACSTSKISTPESESLPALTQNQMLEDHDSLVTLIKQTSPVVFFNKEVRSIDFDKYAKKNRKKISKKTTTAEFLVLIEKTLNAAQDGHTNRLGPALLDHMKQYGIPSGGVKFIDSTDAVNSYKYDAFLRKELFTKLELNLVYTDGEYHTLLPFKFKNTYYPEKMKLLSCNGIEIHQFVTSLMDIASPLRWDRTRNRNYKENFYRYSEIYKNDRITLVFESTDLKKHTLRISKNEEVTFLKDKKWKYTYNDTKEDTVTTHFFEKQGIFYAKLPHMNEHLGDSINNRFKKIQKEQKINAIILDIRGNGGGFDVAYNNALQSIIKDTVKQDMVLGINWSNYTRKYYEFNRDSIHKIPIFSFKTKVPTLQKPEMFYINLNYDFIVPENQSNKFNGKIYLLQDRYIYSAASNLSSLAPMNEQIISIGETSDLLGGMQRSPFVLMLPNSKVIFRVEPQLDFTNNTSLVDTFKNGVEYPVSYSIEELYLRTTTNDSVTSKTFLLNHDSMFKKVLELEKQRLH